MENENTEKIPSVPIELKAKCADMSVKFNYMFIIKIAILIITALTMAASIAVAFLHVPALGVVITVFPFIKLLADIFYVVLLLFLGKHLNDYKIAGILFIVNSLLELLKNLFSQSELNVAISILSAIFGLLFVLTFSNAMISAFERVDLNMTSSWESFRKANIIIFSGILICAVGVFIPILNYIVVFAVFIFAIAAIIVGIWELILLKNSSKIMKSFATAQ